MRKLILASILLLLCTGLGVAQDETELLVLKTLLGVPQNSRVTNSPSRSLPENKPLKIYLDISGSTPERDQVVRDYLRQLIDTWNANESDKSGALLMVASASNAHLAIVHYTDYPTETDERANASTPMEINTATGQPDNVPLVSNSLKMTQVVFTYIVIKDADNLRILYRRKDPLISRSAVVISQSAAAPVTAKLRKDIDKESNRRALKPEYKNDPKAPDYRLREEFSKLLLTRKPSSAKNQ